MKPETLLRLYPRAWRERYGDEFAALLESEPMGFRLLADVIAGAFDAWVTGLPQSGTRMAAPVGPQILWIRRRQPRSLRERVIQATLLGTLVLAAIVLSATTNVSDADSSATRALSESAFQVFPAVAVIPFWFAGYRLRTKIAAFGWTAAGTFVIVFAFNSLFP
jgi:hypothetical protein